MEILFDERWIGSHGIGRFAEEVGVRGGFTALKLGGRPLEMMDSLRLGYALRGRKGHFFRLAITFHWANPALIHLHCMI